MAGWKNSSLQTDMAELWQTLSDGTDWLTE
jgi:hypothetical protein